MVQYAIIFQTTVCDQICGSSLGEACSSFMSECSSAQNQVLKEEVFRVLVYLQKQNVTKCNGKRLRE